jgi:hypothetical protein
MNLKPPAPPRCNSKKGAELHPDAYQVTLKRQITRLTGGLSKPHFCETNPLLTTELKSNLGNRVECGGCVAIYKPVVLRARFATL